MEWITRLRFNEQGPIDLTGRTWTASNTILSDGRFDNKSTILNSKSSFLETESIADIDGDFTISFYAKLPTSLTSEQYISAFGNYEGMSDYYLLFLKHTRFDASSMILTTGKNGETDKYILKLGNAKYDGAWHHYAICRKNGYIVMYIDGVSQKEAQLYNHILSGY